MSCCDWLQLWQAALIASTGLVALCWHMHQPQTSTPKSILANFACAFTCVLQARLFVQAGVEKIRLTGGEPTVRPDLLDIIQRLNHLRPLGLNTIAMTTNGVTLAKQLPALQEAGLNALNISLDSLQQERFENLTRRRGHGRVLESIHKAVQLGFDPVKVG